MLSLTHFLGSAGMQPKTVGDILTWGVAFNGRSGYGLPAIFLFLHKQYLMKAWSLTVKNPTQSTSFVLLSSLPYLSLVYRMSHHSTTLVWP